MDFSLQRIGFSVLPGWGEDDPGALIEALDRLLKRIPDAERLELLRMQEPDGGRRNDEMKAWGWWKGLSNAWLTTRMCLCLMWDGAA